jgi:ABC-2 type transport system permease protein
MGYKDDYNKENENELEIELPEDDLIENDAGTADAEELDTARCDEVEPEIETTDDPEIGDPEADDPDELKTDSEREDSCSPEKPSAKQRLVGGTSKQGVYLTVTTIIVVALVIFVNLLVRQLPQTVTQLDISENDLYTVSDLSKEFIAGIDQDVNLILLAEPTQLDTRISQYVKTYASLSDHITAMEIDPVLYPSYLEKYETDADVLVIENAETGKYTTVALKGYEGYSTGIIMCDYMTMAYYGQDQEISFDAEGQITSAISYVTSDATGTVYMLTGHGESEMGNTVLSRIQKANMSTESADLLMSGGVPEDCELLVCCNPTSDLADDELDILRKYLKSGGDMMIIIDAVDLTNFNTLMAEYGLTMQEGYVGDMSRYYQQYASVYGYYCFAPVLSESSEITGELTTSALLLQPRGMLQTDPARAGITVDPFMTTSERGICYVDENNYAEGTYILGATASETVTEDDPDTDADESVTSHLTVISSIAMIDENVVTAFTNMANMDIFMNAVTMSYDDISNITVPAKSLEITRNTLSGAGLWSIIVTFVIPALLIIGGLIYWTKRRKR